MSEPKPIPPVVNKRNEFESSQMLVDDAVIRLPEVYRSEHFRKWLKIYTDNVILRIDHAFAVGAQRGVEQVSKLLRDPDYYVTLKERRRREMERNRDYQAKQEMERLERKLCPTQEQLDERIRSLERWIPEEKARVQAMEAELQKLKTMVPRNIRMMRPQ